MAAGMARNLLSLVSTYGFVPNGSRSYYLNRSQPPLLAPMVRDIAAALPPAQSMLLIREALPALVREHKHWTSGAKNVLLRLDEAELRLSRYWAELESPRPESFVEDFELAESVCRTEGLEGEDGERRRRQLFRRVVPPRTGTQVND